MSKDAQHSQGTDGKGLIFSAPGEALVPATPDVKLRGRKTPDSFPWMPASHPSSHTFICLSVFRPQTRPAFYFCKEAESQGRKAICLHSHSKIVATPRQESPPSIPPPPSVPSRVSSSSCPPVAKIFLYFSVLLGTEPTLSQGPKGRGLSPGCQRRVPGSQIC